MSFEALASSPEQLARTRLGAVLPPFFHRRKHQQEKHQDDEKMKARSGAVNGESSVSRDTLDTHSIRSVPSVVSVTDLKDDGTMNVAKQLEFITFDAQTVTSDDEDVLLGLPISYKEMQDITIPAMLPSHQENQGCVSHRKADVLSCSTPATASFTAPDDDYLEVSSIDESIQSENSSLTGSGEYEFEEDKHLAYPAFGVFEGSSSNAAGEDGLGTSSQHLSMRSSTSYRSKELDRTSHSSPRPTTGEGNEASQKKKPKRVPGHVQIDSSLSCKERDEASSASCRTNTSRADSIPSKPARHGSPLGDIEGFAGFAANWGHRQSTNKGSLLDESLTEIDCPSPTKIQRASVCPSPTKIRRASTVDAADPRLMFHGSPRKPIRTASKMPDLDRARTSDFADPRMKTSNHSSTSRPEPQRGVRRQTSKRAPLPTPSKAARIFPTNDVLGCIPPPPPDMQRSTSSKVTSISPSDDILGCIPPPPPDMQRSTSSKVTSIPPSNAIVCSIPPPPAADMKRATTWDFADPRMKVSTSSFSPTKPIRRDSPPQEGPAKCSPSGNGIISSIVPPFQRALTSDCIDPRNKVYSFSHMQPSGSGSPPRRGLRRESTWDPTKSCSTHTQERKSACRKYLKASIAAAAAAVSTIEEGVAPSSDRGSSEDKERRTAPRRPLTGRGMTPTKPPGTNATAVTVVAEEDEVAIPPPTYDKKERKKSPRKSLKGNAATKAAADAAVKCASAPSDGEKEGAAEHPGRGLERSISSKIRDVGITKEMLEGLRSIGLDITVTSKQQQQTLPPPQQQQQQQRNNEASRRHAHKASEKALDTV